MILFLHGTDAYRLKERTRQIIEQYQAKHKSGLNLARYDEKTFDLQDLKDRLSAVSMFQEKKLLVLENVLQQKNNKEALTEFLKNSKLEKDQENYLLILHQAVLTGDKRKDSKILADFEKDKLFGYLAKHSYKVEQFYQLSGTHLRNWVLKEFKKRGAQISEQALEFFLANLPLDSWLLSKEIEKIATYTNKVALKDVQALIPQYFSPEIFTTIDAFADKNKKKALELLHQHLNHGDDPLYLLSMIIFQIRNLYFLKLLAERGELKAGNNHGLHSFVFRKTLAQARRFTLPELQHSYRQLYETELAIKTGKLEPETALDFFVAKAF